MQHLVWLNIYIYMCRYRRKRVSQKREYSFSFFLIENERSIYITQTMIIRVQSMRKRIIHIYTVERETFNARGNARNTYKCALCESNYGIGRLKIYISGIPTNSNGRDLMNFHNGPGRDSWRSFNAMEKLFKTPTPRCFFKKYRLSFSKLSSLR